MKLIKLLTNKSGKFTLSTAQTVGVGAAVAVAGLAAWQMFSTPAASSDTVFSAPEESIVYVANGAGAYDASANAIGVGGERQSAIRAALSKDYQLMEMDGSRPQMEMEQQEDDIKSFKMDGQSEGLGMGKDGGALGNGAAPGGFDMSALQQQMAALQGIAQQQAANAQAAGAGAAAADSAATKGGAGDRFAMAEGMAHANGNNLNADPLQAAAYEGDPRSGTLGGETAADSQTNKEGRLNMTNRPATFKGGRDSFIAESQRFETADNLEGYEATARHLAKQEALNASSLSAIYMGSDKVSSRIHVDGDTMESLGGGGSADFDAPDLSGLDSIGGEYRNFVEDSRDMIDTLQQFRDDLKKYVCTIPKEKGLRVRWEAKKDIVATALMEKEGGIKEKVESFKSKWENDKDRKETAKELGKYVEKCYKKLKKRAKEGYGANYLDKKYKEYADEYWPDNKK